MTETELQARFNRRCPTSCPHRTGTTCCGAQAISSRHTSAGRGRQAVEAWLAHAVAGG